MSGPWSDETIDSLKFFQGSQLTLHRYTRNGGRHHSEHVHDHEVLLVPTWNGWICPAPVDHIVAGEDPNGEGTWLDGF